MTDMIISDLQSNTELLVTKLKFPLLGSKIVSRSRLLHHLQNGVNYRATLITAPAGYGKTTLLSEWSAGLSAPDTRIAWLSLDAYDNTVMQFWSYISLAVQKVYPRLHFKIQQIYNSPATLNEFSIFNPLLNEITQIPFQICLVLDDYHTITNESVHRSLRYLIEHQPENLHLIVSSRTTPPIPLTRMRTQNQLLEISSKDLAFNLDEAQSYLSDIMEVNLSPAQLGSLIEVTEGWIAGLQLAAFSYQHNSNWTNFQLTGNSWNNRPVYDYLSEEVFYQQPPIIQDFLLKTSILSELSAPLCDAILDRNDSQECLAHLARANLFITCLDDQGNWYRYHPLMAEVLRRRFEQNYPDLSVELHRRASRWLLSQGYYEPAIAQVLAVDDRESAAEILDSCAEQVVLKFDTLNTIRWISHFSEEMIDHRPGLGIYYAMANYHLGRIDLMEAMFEIVERALGKNTSLPRETGDLIRWQLKVLKSSVKFIQGNFEEGQNQILDLMHTAPENDPFFWGFANHILACAYEKTGELDFALKRYETASQFASKNNLITDHILSRCQIARLRRIQGHLNEAKHEYENILETIDRNNVNKSEEFIPYLGLMGIAIERQTIKFEQPLAPVFSDYLATIENRDCKHRQYEIITAGMARYYLAQCDYASAQQYLQKAKGNLLIQLNRFEHPYSEIIDLQVRLWQATGELNQSERHFKEEIASLNPYKVRLPAEQAAFARIDLCQGNTPTALATLKELEDYCRNTGLGERLIEALILLSVVYQRMGNDQAALSSLSEALLLASPEGYKWIFINEGESMQSLLTKLLAPDLKEIDAPSSPVKEYARELASDIDRGIDKQIPTAIDLPPIPAMIMPMHEPLSSREYEVLSLLVKGKSMKEIAEILMISINTAKAHTKKIYRKFGVHDRKGIIHRVRQFNSY